MVDWLCYVRWRWLDIYLCEAKITHRIAFQPHPSRATVVNSHMARVTVVRAKAAFVMSTVRQDIGDGVFDSLAGEGLGPSTVGRVNNVAGTDAELSAIAVRGASVDIVFGGLTVGDRWGVARAFATASFCQCKLKTNR